MGCMNEYFQRSEFACQCGCGMDTVDYELLKVLTDVREHFGKPVICTSGNRCDLHNNGIGAPKSQHTLSKAADFYVRGIEVGAVHSYLEYKYPDQYGLGLYERENGGWVHIDVRGHKARWQES